MKQFPSWALETTKEIRRVLRLEVWTIIWELSPNPAGDAGNNGSCWANADTLVATITINDAIPPVYDVDDYELMKRWIKTLIHEMLHISHAGIDMLLRNVITTELGGAGERIAEAVYISQMEQFIANMTNVIFELMEESKICEEQPPAIQ